MYIVHSAMDPGFDDLLTQQRKILALPEEDIDSYLVRRAKPDESWVFLQHTSLFQSYDSLRPFQLGNLPSLLSDSMRNPDPVGSQEGETSQVNIPSPVASALPQTPVKGSNINAADKPAPVASHSQKELSPRRVTLTIPKRVAPTLKSVQSSPIDVYSPVASSTPAKPPSDKAVDVSPLLGKRRHDEADIRPTKLTKPKSKGKSKAVEPAPEHSSPIESPPFDASISGPAGKRPRGSGETPSPPPKRRMLRAGALPTSPINSSVFPPITELPPVLGRQGSITVSSGQMHKKPRNDKVIKITPLPVEVPAGDTSVIESFDTSPPKPPTIAKHTVSADSNKKPQVPPESAAAETSVLTSPGTSPEKRSTFPLLPPPNAAQHAQVKRTVTGPAITNLADPKDVPASNTKDLIETNPLAGRRGKMMGITKLKPAATTVLPTEAGPSKNTSAMPLRSNSTLGQVQKGKHTITLGTRKGKEKPAKMTPVEYAEMLIEKNNNPDRRIPNVSQHLRGRKILYVGVDMRYAGDATKKKMEYVRTFSTLSLSIVFIFSF